MNKYCKGCHNPVWDDEEWHPTCEFAHDLQQKKKEVFRKLQKNNVERNRKLRRPHKPYAPRFM